MGKQPSFADMFELYLHNLDVLKDWTFIVATTEPDNMDLYAGMENIEGIKERMFTPFANGRVSIINYKIFKRCWQKNDSRVRMQKCVSFDTQTVSYIERYYKNGNALYEGFNEVIRLLKSSNFGVDHIPYTMENLMLYPERKASVEETLFAYEMMCGQNVSKTLLCRMRAKAVISLYGKRNFEFPFRAKEIYKMVYLSLLKMSQIQMGNAQLPIDQKMKLFLEFMTTRICRVMQPEINLAKLYFTDGGARGFFGKIHVRNKDLLGPLKNMTWDLMHLRFMDYSSTMFNTRKSDVLIPYFFTYDRRLQHIRSCYSLQTLAINTKNHAVIPIYAFGEGVLELVKEQCTYTKHQERMGKTVDVDQLIAECEQELLKLVYKQKL